MPPNMYQPQPTGPVGPPGQQPITAAQIKKRHTFLVPLIITAVLALVFIGLFIWAYLGMTDYKNNVTPKIEAAVKVATDKEATRKDSEFIEKEKSPTKTFTGPDTFGAVTFAYPKTWSAYVIQSEKSSTPLDGYFHPDYVPDVAGSTAFALRVKIVDKTYDAYVKSLEGKVKAGKVKLAAYTPTNQTTIVASRVDGEVNTGQKNHLVIIPLRDKTIEIGTESDQFLGDFEKIILPSLKFTP